MKSVVVTGLGVVTPLGCGTRAFWDGLLAQRSGVRRITKFDASDLPVQIAAEVPDFDPSGYLDAREVKRTDLFAQMAVVAAGQAWDHSGLSHDDVPEERIGVIVGSGIGGLETLERDHRAMLSGGPRRVSAFMIPKLMVNAAAGMIAMKHGFRGPSYAPVSACATAAHAIGEACRAIETGHAEAMVAGGAEAALTPLSVSAFARMGALTSRNDDPERASRPFDAQRDGFVFGEGAGVLVLERRDLAERRNADIIAEVAGYGASADAFHITQPEPEGRGAAQAMTAALRDARMQPEDVDYVNAHGTSTPHNDRAETQAIKEVMGPESKRVPVSSTKSQIGHLLGAAGAVEAAATALAITKGVVPATINYEEPDPDCDLDYVTDGPRDQMIRTALSNSFGFGGLNATLLLRAA